MTPPRAARTRHCATPGSRDGYYGGLTPRGDLPPMLVVPGEKDMMLPAAAARAFAEQVRAVSSHPVRGAGRPTRVMVVQRSRRASAIAAAVAG